MGLTSDGRWDGRFDDRELALKARIAELEAENARLSDPTLKDLRLEGGGINMAVAGPIVERLALAMTGYFRESGAENYIEMNLNARDDTCDRYCVTVQKVGMQSPHQLRQAAEAENDRLKSELRDEQQANIEIKAALRDLVEAFRVEGGTVILKTDRVLSVALANARAALD